MKTFEEVTLDEYNMCVQFHRQVGFNNDELAAMYNFVRAYVNPSIPTCLSCSGNIRDAKTQMMSFFLFHQPQIEARLFPVQIDEVIESFDKRESILDKAEKEAKDYKKKK